MLEGKAVKCLLSDKVPSLSEGRPAGDAGCGEVSETPATGRSERAQGVKEEVQGNGKRHTAGRNASHRATPDTGAHILASVVPDLAQNRFYGLMVSSIGRMRVDLELVRLDHAALEMY
jgi:hypothetical protein